MKAVLIQEEEWYDTINVEELPTQLNSNLAEVEKGTGIKFGVIIYMLGVAIGSTAVWFYIGYLLTFPMILLWFIILGIGGIEIFFSMKGEKHQREAYSKSGAQAEQSINSIKVVKAFGQEKEEWNKFQKHLEKTQLHMKRHSWIYGFSKGLLELIIYIIWVYGYILSGIFILNEVKDLYYLTIF